MNQTATHSFDKSILTSLDSSIGLDSRKKVVRAFLTTVPVFHQGIKDYISKNDLEEINNLGHRFKSSSMVVGGTLFSDYCKALEQATSMNEVNSVASKASQALVQLEDHLQIYT